MLGGGCARIEGWRILSARERRRELLLRYRVRQTVFTVAYHASHLPSAGFYPTACNVGWHTQSNRPCDSTSSTYPTRFQPQCGENRSKAGEGFAVVLAPSHPPGAAP